MEKAEALQQNLSHLTEQWTAPTKDAKKARGEAVRRIWAGETLKFVYHEFSNRAPVDEIIFISGAVGQQDLGLFIEPLIHVWKPTDKKE